MLVTNPERRRHIVAHAQEFNVPLSSPMFLRAITTASCLSSESVPAMIQFLASLGWSEAKAAMAVSKCLLQLRSSDDGLCRAVEFLTMEGGLNAAYIRRRQVLLKYSIERRLVPWHYVMKVLESKGLPEGDFSFYTAATQSNERFLEKFVHPHEDTIPWLAVAYATACTGKLPAQVAL